MLPPWMVQYLPYPLGWRSFYRTQPGITCSGLFDRWYLSSCNCSGFLVPFCSSLCASKARLFSLIASKSCTMSFTIFCYSNVILSLICLCTLGVTIRSSFILLLRLVVHIFFEYLCILCVHSLSCVSYWYVCEYLFHIGAFDSSLMHSAAVAIAAFNI